MDDFDVGGGRADEPSEPRRRVRAAKPGEGESKAEDGAYAPSDSAARKAEAQGSVGNPIAIAFAVRDKLQLLDYTHSFCKTYGLKPIPPMYFAVQQANPIEQLNYLAMLIHWLCEETGHVFLKPEVFEDDPNATATTLVQQVKKLGKFSVDIAPAKMKAAHGEAVLALLSQLCDVALEAAHFDYERAVQPAETTAGERTDEIEDEAAEHLLVTEELPAGDEDLEDDFASSGGAGVGGIGGGGPQGTPVKDARDKAKTALMESKINPAAWKLELERVAPQLKVTVGASEVREWRSRLELMTTFLSYVSANFPENKTALDKMATEVRQVLEKLTSREKYFNTQLEHLMADYRVVAERAADQTDKYKAVASKVTEATNELNSLTDELEEIKTQMSSKGETMTDASPVQQIKHVIAQIKGEIQEFDVKIAVIQQVLLQRRIKQAQIKASQKKGGASTRA